MKMNLKWLSLGGVLAVAVLMAINLQASDKLDRILNDDLFEACMTNVKKDCQSWALQGGGSEVPRGLTTDSKAELAIGEKYILSGRVTIADGEVYFRVDFDQHPWLASAVRLRNPFYRINDSTSNWRRYQGQDVTLVATAHYSTWAEKDRTILEIYLEPSAYPIITGLQPAASRRASSSKRSL